VDEEVRRGLSDRGLVPGGPQLPIGFHRGLVIVEGSRELAEDGGPTMGDLLGDPEWDRREVRLAIIRIRANIQHDYAGKAKILTWHATQMRPKVARLRQDYPAACQDMEAELAALEVEAMARAEQLEARARALPSPKHRHSWLGSPS
jgi:hypothetical protein